MRCIYFRVVEYRLKQDKAFHHIDWYGKKMGLCFSATTSFRTTRELWSVESVASCESLATETSTHAYQTWYQAVTPVYITHSFNFCCVYRSIALRTPLSFEICRKYMRTGPKRHVGRDRRRRVILYNRWNDKNQKQMHNSRRNRNRERNPPAPPL